MKRQQDTIKTFDALKARLTTTVDEYAVAFGEKFKLGLEAIRDAAAIYCEAVRKYPASAQDTFMTRYPGVSSHTWELLGKIGTDDLHPSALLLPYETAKAVCRIPYDRQCRMFDAGVRGFYVVNKATLRPRIVSLSALTAPEADLLIDVEKGEVRTVAQQRQLVLDRQKVSLGKTIGDSLTRQQVPYRICGNVCIINGVELGLGTLKAIVAEMEARGPRRK